MARWAKGETAISAVVEGFVSSLALSGVRSVGWTSSVNGHERV
jgi:hypothetical protein